MVVGVAQLYAVVGFGMVLVHNTFLVFAVDTFVAVHRLAFGPFASALAVFALWNSVNDLAFGWLLDGWLLKHQPDSPNWIGVHYGLALCAYDGVFTLVVLLHNALMTELAARPSVRGKAVSANALASVLASLPAFGAYLLWSPTDGPRFAAFQKLAVVFAVVSTLAIGGGAWLLQPHERRMREMRARKQRESESDKLMMEKKEGESQQRPLSLMRVLAALACLPNFVWFTAVNFLQILVCSFNNTFFRLFLDFYLGSVVSASARAMLVTASYVLPHVFTIVSGALVARHGAYLVIRALFRARVGLGVAAWLAVALPALGGTTTAAVCLGSFVVLNRLVTEGTCRLMNVALADVVDEEAAVAKRATPLSALIFGTNAFVTKPAQSLAPALGWYFLSASSSFASPAADGSAASSFFASDGDADARQATYSEASGELQSLIGKLVVLVPALAGSLQLLAWSQYSLRGWYLRTVKASHEA
ncbi:transmembrane protein 180 [Thecamonas trahens ATCC 50062]|uniref:Transmembrane protein 180 n=1 Tax=Thecamonas trahens ATCC 50062 TaxID=461836 RepID=A0A0L0DG70_THETB|nr:transmembrane protein 180 [Thecamonas trahens ATCC 50062]KNC51180.1 transmembrane protein 180 [Thecamonas trahens ATCC 50062]|eukprot:XP_013756382.1 transmembrane protein 180 [Thecamonas trahens ATCC 50062]